MAEVEALSGGEGVHSLSLGQAVERRPNESASVLAILDFRDGPECARESESAREEPGDLDRCGGDEPDLLPGIEVTLCECEGSGDELVDHAVVEDLLAEREQLIDASTFNERESGRRGRCHVLQVFGATEDEAQLLDAEAPDLVAAEVVTTGQPDGEVEDARTSHDRVVHVEEGSGGSRDVSADRLARSVGGGLSGLAIGREQVRCIRNPPARHGWSVPRSWHRYARVGSMSERTNLASLLRGPAGVTPDRAALIDGARRLTWSELDEAVDHVAGGLREQGLHPGDRVALLLGNSIEFVVGYFAILRAGLVVVALNPAYTVAEVAVLLTDSGARLVFVDETTVAVGSGAVEAIASCEVVDVSSALWRRLLTSQPIAPGDESVAPNGLALLLFTAGTSGRPKGAMLSHAALLANIDMLRSLEGPPAVLESDTVLLVLPLFHVYGLNTGLGLAVSAGATCVIVDRFDPVESLRLIANAGVTTVAGAPAMYQAWSRVPAAREACQSIRLLSSGGSPLPVAVFDAFAALTGKTIFEGYGMTETAPVVSTTLVTGVAKAGSVGRPLPGLQVRLVDDSGQEVDDGDPGEVWVRGASVFTGYWPAGLGGPDSDGWFRSGDVAYVDAEGDLYLVDRRREVILVSGFNVYPREIELAIESLAGVIEVAVVGVPDDATGEAVSAIVVTSEGSGPSREEIAAHCATRLARFKCPSSIRVVDALPHSSTGKIAKGRLREVYGEQ